MSEQECGFCRLIGLRQYKGVNEHAVLMEPPIKLTADHMIVLPLTHVPDALTNPVITAQAYRYAAMVARRPCDLLTNIGQMADNPNERRARHFHIHVIPRHDGDGITYDFPGEQGT